ncbi:MAG: DUF4349 domain-containing protein [Actinomycetales bacterium]|nr:DUF4349 domain-containing protein [Actinomycetales bacterium]
MAQPDLTQHVTKPVPGARSRRRSARRTVLAAAALLAVLLGGCSAQDMSAGDSGAPVFEDGAVSDYDSSGGGAGVVGDVAGDRDAPRPGTDVGASERYRVREASLGLKVDDIAEAAEQVRQVAAEAGGSVIDERFGDEYYGPEGTSIERFGTMTISVPSERLDATLEDLSRVGEVRTRSSSSYDVEDEYVDVEARIATLEASIDRMRALMEQTEDIDQIVSLETALSARQADLDSLRARLTSLQNRIAMSPVHVTLTTTDDLGQPEGGITGALKDAWNAFTRSAAVLITTIGALLPWLVVGGLALWLLTALIRWVRARRHGRSSSATTDPAQRPVRPETKDPKTS